MGSQETRTPGHTQLGEAALVTDIVRRDTSPLPPRDGTEKGEKGKKQELGGVSEFKGEDHPTSRPTQGRRHSIPSAELNELSGSLQRAADASLVCPNSCQCWDTRLYVDMLILSLITPQSGPEPLSRVATGLPGGLVLAEERSQAEMHQPTGCLSSGASSCHITLRERELGQLLLTQLTVLALHTEKPQPTLARCSLIKHWLPINGQLCGCSASNSLCVSRAKV